MGVDEFILRPWAEDLDQVERLAEIAASHSYRAAVPGARWRGPMTSEHRGTPK